MPYMRSRQHRSFQGSAFNNPVGRYQSAQAEAPMTSGTAAMKPQAQHPSPQAESSELQQPTPSPVHEEAQGPSDINGSNDRDTKMPIENEPSSDQRISHKIYNVHGKDKVIDFVSILSKAHLKDFANIHGRTGSSYAPNSTIGLTICDSTKDDSVTVKFSVDVRDMEFLLEAAKLAYFNRLERPSASPESIYHAMNMISSWVNIPSNPDGTRSIPNSMLNELHGAIESAASSQAGGPGDAIFSYIREKNNPSKIDPETGFGPVSKVTINYSPIDRQGRPNGHPWFICIENFTALIQKQGKGLYTHKSSTATNKRKGFINLSREDFYSAMIAVDRFVRLWEFRQMGPVMDEAYGILNNNRFKY